MGRLRERREAELRKRCDEVLHYVWDPIGVAGTPGARDEYRSYVSKVLTLVRDEAPPEKIAKHLNNLEANSMGLTPNEDRAIETAKVLLEWREWIWEYGS